MRIIDTISARTLAELFHSAYERLAPEYGYDTREHTRVFDPKTPNGQLMIATANAVLTTLRLYEARHALPPKVNAK